jgi:HSP20 family protein
MARSAFHNRMWQEAVALLDRAERLNREGFAPRGSSGATCWEPPVDMLETEREVLILAALPGVDLGHIEATIEGGTLVIAGRRTLPLELRTAIIHRLELPQGRFERRLRLPPGRYDAVQRVAVNGCLLFTLRKAEVRS